MQGGGDANPISPGDPKQGLQVGPFLLKGACAVLLPGTWPAHRSDGSRRVQFGSK